MNTIKELQKYHDEISERCDNLLAFIKSDDAKLIHENDRHLISLEYSAASELLCVLRRRMEKEIEVENKLAYIINHEDSFAPSSIEFGDVSEFWRDEFMV